jgi:hypothetical protein
MGILTFFGMLITGSVFSWGLLLLFQKKVLPGVLLMVLSVICYIVYVSVATAYFA